MLKRRFHRLIRVYTCQNARLLEITCHGSYYYNKSYIRYKFPLSNVHDRMNTILEIGYILSLVNSNAYVIGQNTSFSEIYRSIVLVYIMVVSILKRT